MTASSVQGPSRSADRFPARRCCRRHADWPTLAQHLLDQFPDATIGEVVRELRRARDAVDELGLGPDEALAVGEALVRERLAVVAGYGAEA